LNVTYCTYEFVSYTGQRYICTLCRAYYKIALYIVIFLRNLLSCTNKYMNLYSYIGYKSLNTITSNTELNLYIVFFWSCVWVYGTLINSLDSRIVECLRINKDKEVKTYVVIRGLAIGSLCYAHRGVRICHTQFQNIRRYFLGFQLQLMHTFKLQLQY